MAAPIIVTNRLLSRTPALTVWMGRVLFICVKLLGGEELELMCAAQQSTIVSRFISTVRLHCG